MFKSLIQASIMFLLCYTPIILLLLEHYYLIFHDLKTKTLMYIFTVYLLMLWIYALWVIYRIDIKLKKYKPSIFILMANVTICIIFALPSIGEILTTSDIDTKYMNFVTLFVAQSAIFIYYCFLLFFSLRINKIGS